MGIDVFVLESALSVNHCTTRIGIYSSEDTAMETVKKLAWLDKTRGEVDYDENETYIDRFTKNKYYSVAVVDRCDGTMARYTITRELLM